VPYICLKRRILKFTIDHLRALRVVVRGSSPDGYLATSIDQLVTLLFAMYAREVAKALPSNKAYPPRGTENALRARLTA
jgi:hypothetical protein